MGDSSTALIRSLKSEYKKLHFVEFIYSLRKNPWRCVICCLLELLYWYLYSFWFKI